ncbi:MAG: lipopolysaccharide biosynthesis protein, partial [Daejeonella sp.]|nr:lipopolysaccharide biosynthesis protein [Daejeonella sp.]
NIRFTRKNGKPFSRLQDSIIRVIVKDIQENFLSVGKPNKKLSIIKVDVKSNNEFFSKVFNEQIVKNVNDFYVQTKTQRSLENVTILQQKTDSVRAVMNGAIYTAVEIGDATPNSNPTHQVRRIAPIQRSQFTAETNKTILAELIKNLEMSKIALRKETPLIQVVDQPLFPLDKVKVSKIKATIVGGLVAGIIMILILVVSRSYKMIMI